MPPKRQPSRQQLQAEGSNMEEIIARRTRKHLEELERSNYQEDTGVAVEHDAETTAGSRNKKSRGSARQTISDKKDWGTRPGKKKKKKKEANMNIRDALLYRQNLSTIIERSGIADMPGPTYLTAVAPPPTLPPRIFCSVCGYWGKYRCMKCAMPYCSLECRATHNDTRCEKLVI